MTMQARLGLLVLGLSLVACGPDSKPKASTGDAKREAEAKPRAAEVTDVGDAPLHNGQPSLEALGQALVAGLEAKDGRALIALAVPQSEYSKRLFAAVEPDPAVLAQGPVRAWATHDQINRAGLAKALREHGGKGYAFVRLQPAGREERRGLVIYRNPRLTVTDPEGESLELPILSAVIEHPASGTFSVLGYAP